MSKNSDPLDQWEQEIKRRVSIEDQLLHKDIGTKIAKQKKIKKILFITLSVAGIVTIVGATIGVTSRKKMELVTYDDYIDVSLYSQINSKFKELYLDGKQPDKKNYPITWNVNTKPILGEPFEILKKILSEGAKLDNEIFKEFNFKYDASQWNPRLTNFFLDAINRKHLHFDIYLENKKHLNQSYVVRNFTIETTNVLDNEMFSETQIAKWNEQDPNISKAALTKNWNFYYVTKTNANLNFENDKTFEELRNKISNFNNKILNNSDYNYVDKSLWLTSHPKKTDESELNYFKLFQSDVRDWFVPFNFLSQGIQLKRDENNENNIFTKTLNLEFKSTFYTIVKNKLILKNKSSYEYAIYVPFFTNKDKTIKDGKEIYQPRVFEYSCPITFVNSNYKKFK
ncbi:hypothetical protein [Metamycoplasma hominis]|uniref:hypothetical protein n=1 Tax=Metamycoplasma hominis TaxID=2098 RepID=UPI002410FCEB|nr:hypothetical protein [Metamycoplasma hominis]